MTIRIFACLALAAGLMCIGPAPADGIGDTQLASHSYLDPAAGGNGGSESSRVGTTSANGRYVVFESVATDLVSGFTNNNGAEADVYLFDRVSGTVVLVSHDYLLANSSGNALSYNASVSADGRFVTFNSSATNLIAGFTDNNGDLGDIFLFERSTGAISLVSRSVGNGAAGGNDHNGDPVIDSSGAFVAFISRSTNLVSGFKNKNGDGIDVFRFNRDTEHNRLVSHAFANHKASGDGTSNPARISADGRFVTFSSQSRNLVAGFADRNEDARDVFLFDGDTGELRLVSHAANSATVGSNAPTLKDGFAVISDNGRRIAFSSAGTNLVAGFENNNGPAEDLYVYDRSDGSVTLASHSSAAPTSGGDTSTHGTPGISASGRFLAFTSGASNLVAGFDDRNATGSDAYRYDAETGDLVLVSHIPSRPKVSGNGSSAATGVSFDGGVVSFVSAARNLVAGFVNNNGTASDVYLYDVASSESGLVSHDYADALKGGDESTFGKVSRNGLVVVMFGGATNLISGFTDNNGTGLDVFVSA